MKNGRNYDLKLNYQGNYVKSSSNTKFLGLIIDDSQLWKSHIDQMMSKLNTACFVIRTIQAVMSQTLRMVYFAHIHSIMSYGIIFGGNQPYSEKILKIQRRVFRIIANSRKRDSCRELLKKLEILPLYSQYIFSISVFVMKKQTFTLYRQSVLQYSHKI